MTFNEEEFSNIACCYRAWPKESVTGVADAFNAMVSYVKCLIAESEASAIESIRARDAVLEELADYKRQANADVRNHPAFMKMAEREATLQRRAAYHDELTDILEERLALAGREIELLKSDRFTQ